MLKSLLSQSFIVDRLRDGGPFHIDGKRFTMVRIHDGVAQVANADEAWREVDVWDADISDTDGRPVSWARAVAVHGLYRLADYAIQLTPALLLALPVYGYVLLIS